KRGGCRRRNGYRVDGRYGGETALERRAGLFDSRQPVEIRHRAQLFAAARSGRCRRVRMHGSGRTVRTRLEDEAGEVVDEGSDEIEVHVYLEIQQRRVSRTYVLE